MGVIVTIPEAAMDYAIFGDKSSVISNYLYHQLQTIPQITNDFTRRIYDNVKTTYDFLNDKLTQYGLKSSVENNGINIQDVNISELMSIDELRNANLNMQRWIMTHPYIHKLYTNNDIDGYSNTYVELLPKKEMNVAENYNYRRVMDGVLVDKDDRWHFKTYIDNLLPGDRDLDFREKVKILNTWSYIDNLLSDKDFKIDFTNQSDEGSEFNRG